ncbi:WhiB family transcriptional regulator [Streptomyces thermodiastaticus]
MIALDTAFGLAAVLIARSRETPDGHRVWTGDPKGRFSYYGQYTYRQAAHIIRTGTPPRGPVRTTCGVVGCFTHISDAGLIPEPAATPDPAWRTRAACRSHDADLWFPEDHTDTATVQALAVGICVACPVRSHCLDDALAVEGSRTTRYGIRGGLTGPQRAREYKRRIIAAQEATEPAQTSAPTPKQKRQPAQCGTRSGYQKHLREKTPICDPCRKANSAADARLRRTGTTKALI